MRRAVLVALARAVNAIFFLTTSSYCLLTYSSFAYQQFIKPHLVDWLTGFVVWHHLAFWLMLMLTAWTLLPELRRGRWRGVAWSYLAISAVIGAVLLVKPVLPQVENNGRGLALAIAALLPIWLAVFDHRKSQTRTASSEVRVFKSAFIAAVVVWACQVAVIPWRWEQTGDITLRTRDFAFGILTSLVGHVLVFAILAAAVSVVIRAGRKTGAGAVEYWLIVATAAVGVMLATNRIVFAGIAFTGAAAWTLSFLLGVLVAAVWSGVVHILHSDRPMAGESAIDWWLSPLPFHLTKRVAIGVLASLVVVEAAAINHLMTFDWDFLLQKLFVLVVWFVAFGYTWFAVRAYGEALSGARLAAQILLPMACFGASVGVGRAVARENNAFVPEFALEGYVAVDPSYRLVHDTLALSSAEQARFYAHLRENSLIQHVNVDPIQIDFDRTLTPSSGRKPHIFLIDLIQELPHLRSQRPATSEAEHQAVEGRVLGASIAASLILSLVYAVLAASGISNNFEPDLLLTGQALGFAVSIVYHSTISLSFFLVCALLVRAASGRFLLQYALISLAIIALLATASARIVGDALSLRGWSAALAAVATGCSIAGTWTGLRLRSLASREVSPLDLYLGSTRPSWLLRLGLAVVFAYTAIRVSSRVDWDFALLDSSVLIVWLTVFALAYQWARVLPSARGWLVAVLCVAPLVANLALSTRESIRITLDRYGVYNPSFRVAEAILGRSGETISSFDRYLRAHTGLTDVSVAPIDINFVEAPLEPPPNPRPSIFLFVIDSLRPDYLAPYNSAVRFTPRMADFAAESVVFTNAITRYGGTGLSVPAIWAGSAILHKQYVTPFHSMNTLEKLLDANHYTRLVGLDSIMGQLLKPSKDIEELDRGRPVMDYEFCRTLDELASKLPADPKTPVFAYSLPQDIHMSKLPRTVESGEEYQSFYAPYATKVHAIDGCFGKFIDTLKAKGRFDDSLIVLAADHGEMLGEDGRFGHSYHLFPQTVRVPLIIHLPSRIAREASIQVDPDAVSLTTDIVPTIYDALGYKPLPSNDLMGRSLIRHWDPTSYFRRRDAYVIAASYGAVYAVASHNGRRLYVADAVRGGDQAFEEDRSGKWSSVKVTSGLRAVNQFAIRRYIDELSRMYELPDISN